jgi:hypothetical protein
MYDMEFRQNLSHDVQDTETDPLMDLCNVELCNQCYEMNSDFESHRNLSNRLCYRPTRRS